MFSILILFTCACVTYSAFVAPERRNIKPTHVTAWRDSVKLNASYLDGLGGGNTAPPPKQTSYSPFKKIPKQPSSDSVQPNFNEAKTAAAEAIGHALEEKVSAEEATETSSVETPITDAETISLAAEETSYEPAIFDTPQSAAVTPEPAAIAPPQPAAFATSEHSEILPFGPAQMLPNAAMMHGETDPTIPGGDTEPILSVPALTTTSATAPLDRSPKDRDYLEKVVDGPSNLNFRDSFAPYPKRPSGLGRGSYSSYSQSWSK